MEFEALLAKFEEGLKDQESFGADRKATRRAVRIVEELEQLDLPVTVEIPDVAPLRAWLESGGGGDLKDLAEKVQGVLDVSDTVGVPDDQVNRAVALLSQWGESQPKSNRYLSQPLTLVLPDGKTRKSKRGDWGSIRNQAKQLTELSKQDLNEVRALLLQGKNAEVEGVQFVLG